MRQLIAFSLASFLSFASVNAYVLPDQVEAAILLSEDGTPRCRIGDPGESFAALRECDQSDELTGLLESGEEISYGSVSPALIGKTLLANVAIGAATSCLVIAVGKATFDSKDEIRGLGSILMMSTTAVGGIGSMIMVTEAIAATNPAIFTAISSFAFGAGSGTFLCHTPEKETPSDND